MVNAAMVTDTGTREEGHLDWPVMVNPGKSLELGVKNDGNSGLGRETAELRQGNLNSSYSKVGSIDQQKQHHPELRNADSWALADFAHWLERWPAN